MMTAGKTTIFILLLAVASTNFSLFGFFTPHDIGDAVQYIDYAERLQRVSSAVSHEEVQFLLYREPGYPLFLYGIFSVFGSGNMIAVNMMQVVLVALTAFIVFLSLELIGSRKAGLWGALAVVLLPSYTYYANLILSETLFTFLLVTSFWLILKIAISGKRSHYYVLLGVVFAVMGLTRAHLLLLPLAVFALLALMHKPIRSIVVSATVFLAIVGCWVGYIHAKTGEWAVTKGRQEIHLYTRAVRSTLSYKGQVQYLISWLKRSSSGGHEDDILLRYDAWALTREMGMRMSQGYTIEQLKKDSLALLYGNLGSYLFGNGVELVKLMFIEHMYPPVSPYYGRIVRASMYIVLYGMFISGIIMSLRRLSGSLLSGGFNIFMTVAGLYLLYHWLVLAFFDVIPRFNTPYLVFYLLIGIAGWLNNIRRSGDVA